MEHRSTIHLCGRNFDHTSTMMLLTKIQPMLDARAHNQFPNLDFADHTLPRATLDVSHSLAENIGAFLYAT